MSKFWQIVKAAGIVAAVVTLGILVGWLGTRSNQVPVAPPMPPAPPSPEHVEAKVSPPETPLRSTNKGEIRVRPRKTNTTEVVTAIPINLITNWEDPLNNTLGRNDLDASSKAKELLEMFPRLPEEGQVEVAQHIANLTADKDFAPLGAYLTAPETPESVIDVLMADLLNRPNSVKLPVLLDVARSCPEQKTADEAKEILTLFLDEDHGADSQAWQTKLQQWLADNPD